MTEILKTLRSVRVGGFAVFDFATAFAGMYYLAPHIGIKPEKALWLTLPTGIISHVIFKVDTPLNQMVLGKDPNRLAQAIILLCLFKAITCCKT